MVDDLLQDSINYNDDKIICNVNCNVPGVCQAATVPGSKSTMGDLQQRGLTLIRGLTKVYVEKFG